MKKYLSIICAIAMLASLTGCGSSDSDSESKSKSSKISASETEKKTEKETEKEEATPEQGTTEEATEEVTEAPTEEQTEPITKKDTDDIDALNDVEVETKADTVAITIPADLITDQDKTVEDGKGNPKFLTVVPNPDGSVTYTMTKETHAELLKELNDQFDESVKSLVDESETIASIEHNDDYTSYSIHVTNAEDFKNNKDSFAVLGMVLASNYYLAFKGKTISSDEIQIHYFDANGNEFEG
jgi:hypothetical protein